MSGSDADCQYERSSAGGGRKLKYEARGGGRDWHVGTYRSMTLCAFMTKMMMRRWVKQQSLSFGTQKESGESSCFSRLIAQFKFKKLQDSSDRRLAQNNCVCAAGAAAYAYTEVPSMGP
eukprot:1231554-Rhodomonas_salina.1